MSISKHIGIVVMTWIVVGIAAPEAGKWLSGSRVQGFATEAEARVGRPLTPVSVAGVARRTTRRCAAGVYNC